MQSAAILDNAAAQRWGTDAEGELEKLGLSRSDIAAQRIQPGDTLYLEKYGKVEF